MPLPTCNTDEYRKSESSVPSLSYLTFLRDPTKSGKLAVTSASDWLKLDNQRWMIEHRLAVLVNNHVQDTKKGIDTSFNVHALTMAHGDFVYWRGLWDVIGKAETAFMEPLESLAQVVSATP
jgi:acyl-CoA oxidase